MTTTNNELTIIELSETDKEMLSHILVLARREAEVTMALELETDAEEDYTDALLDAYNEAVQWMEENDAPAGATAWRLAFEINAAFDALVEAEVLDSEEDGTEANCPPAVPVDPSSTYLFENEFLNMLTGLAHGDAGTNVAIDQDAYDSDFGTDLLNDYKEAVRWVSDDANAHRAGVVASLQEEIQKAWSTLEEIGFTAED